MTTPPEILNLEALGSQILSGSGSLGPYSGYFILALNGIIGSWGQGGVTIDPNGAGNPEGQQVNQRSWFSFLYNVARGVPVGFGVIPNPAPPGATPDQLNLVAFNNRCNLGTLTATDITVLVNALDAVIGNWGVTPGVSASPDNNASPLGTPGDTTNAAAWFAALIFEATAGGTIP
jgi:hypothetical protein